MNKQLKLAYRKCRKMAQTHYENFPVASILLPARMRSAVAVVYCFARRADDIADEGDFSDEERLLKLELLEQQVIDTFDDNPPEEFLFIALHDVIQKYQTPIELYTDLISAFMQDVSKKRYEHFGELMDYCRRSANPVGRLLLHLSRNATERNLALSDGVCSALQLINFYQDLVQDYHELKRIYIPQEDLQKFNITEAHFQHQTNDQRMQKLMQYEFQRAEKLLRAGAPLGKQLNGRFGFEIRLIIAAGFKVLEKLYQQDNVFSRPRLSRSEYIWIVWKALRAK